MPSEQCPLGGLGEYDPQGNEEIALEAHEVLAGYKEEHKEGHQDIYLQEKDRRDSKSVEMMIIRSALLNKLAKMPCIDLLLDLDTDLDLDILSYMSSHRGR